jgi:hypothetical protein
MPFLSSWIHIKYEHHALHGMSCADFYKPGMLCQARCTVTALAGAARIIP